MVDHIIGPSIPSCMDPHDHHIPSTEADASAGTPTHTRHHHPTTQSNKRKPISTTRLSWRLDNLQKPASHTAYLSAIQDHSHIFENSAPCPARKHTLTQEALELSDIGVAGLIGEAAQASIGQRRVTPRR
jgi:hypothetical protein